MSVIKQVNTDIFMASSDFDNEAEEISPAHVFTQDVCTRVEQVVEFEYDYSIQPGPLANGIPNFRTEDAFLQQLGNDMQKYKADCPAILSRWANSDDGSYLRLLKTNQVFTQKPRVIGFERTCDGCSGPGYLRCGGCNGHGVLTCGNCRGSGRGTCRYCGGFQSMTCPGCGGQPIKYTHESVSVWDPSIHQYVMRSRPVNIKCQQCHVTGRVRCTQCDTDGKVTCGGCNGHGEVDCSNCNSHGKVACKTCAATGVEGVTGTITAKVALTANRTGRLEDDTLKSLIGNHIETEDMADYGQVTRVQHTAGESRVISEYNVALTVEKAAIQYGRKNYTIYGFGDQCAIFDYQGLLENTHQSTLLNFSSKIDSSGPFNFNRIKHLTEALETVSRIVHFNPAVMYPCQPQAKLEEARPYIRGRVTRDNLYWAQTLAWKVIEGVVKAHYAKLTYFLLIAAAAMFWFVSTGNPSPCGMWLKFKAFLYTLPLLVIFDCTSRFRTQSTLDQWIDSDDLKAVAWDVAKQWRIYIPIAMLATIWLTYYVKVYFASSMAMCR